MTGDVTYRAIPNWDGYLAGSDGNIYSLMNTRWARREKMADAKPKKARAGRFGYLFVQLVPARGQRTRPVSVHKLVASAFLPDKPTPRHEIRHLDGSRTNNRPDNLAWGTAKENAQDRDAHGRTARGERVGGAKLNPKAVMAIFARASSGKETKTAIAAEFGISRRTVLDIKNGRTWACVGLPVSPGRAATGEAMRAEGAE